MNREKPASDTSKIEDPEGLGTSISGRYAHSPGLIDIGGIQQFWNRTPGSGARSLTDSLFKKYGLKSESNRGQTPLTLARQRMPHRRTSASIRGGVRHEDVRSASLFYVNDSVEVTGLSEAANWPMLVNPLAAMSPSMMQQHPMRRAVVNAGKQVSLREYASGPLLSDVIRSGSWGHLASPQAQAGVDSTGGLYPPGGPYRDEPTIGQYGSIVGRAGKTGSSNRGSDLRLFRTISGAQRETEAERPFRGNPRFRPPSVGTPSIGRPELGILSAGLINPESSHSESRTVKVGPDVATFAGLRSLSAYQRMQKPTVEAHSLAGYSAAFPVKPALRSTHSGSAIAHTVNHVFHHRVQPTASDPALSATGELSDSPVAVASHASGLSGLQRSFLYRAASESMIHASPIGAPHFAGWSQALQGSQRRLPETVAGEKRSFDHQLGQQPRHETFEGTLSRSIRNRTTEGLSPETQNLMRAQRGAQFLHDDAALQLPGRRVATQFLPTLGTTSTAQPFLPLASRVPASAPVRRVLGRATNGNERSSSTALASNSPTIFAPPLQTIHAPAFIATQAKRSSSPLPLWSWNSTPVWRSAAQPNPFVSSDVERRASDWTAPFEANRLPTTKFLHAPTHASSSTVPGSLPGAIRLRSLSPTAVQRSFGTGDPGHVLVSAGRKRGESNGLLDRQSTPQRTSAITAANEKALQPRMASPEHSRAKREILPATLSADGGKTWSALQLPAQRKSSSMPDQRIGASNSAPQVSVSLPSVAELGSLSLVGKSPFARALQSGTLGVSPVSPEQTTLLRRPTGLLSATAMSPIRGAGTAELWARSSPMGALFRSSARPPIVTQASSSDQIADLHLATQGTSGFARWTAPRASQPDSPPKEVLNVKAEKRPSMPSAGSAGHDFPLALRSMLIRGPNSNSSGTVQPNVWTESVPPSPQSVRVQRETAPTAPEPPPSPSLPDGRPGGGSTNAISTQTATPAGGNLDELVEKISRRLLRQLIVEQERRGVTRWQ